MLDFVNLFLMKLFDVLLLLIFYLVDILSSLLFDIKVFFTVLNDLFVISFATLSDFLVQAFLFLNSWFFDWLNFGTVHFLEMIVSFLHLFHNMSPLYLSIVDGLLIILPFLFDWRKEIEFFLMLDSFVPIFFVLNF